MSNQNIETRTFQDGDVIPTEKPIIGWRMWLIEAGRLVSVMSRPHQWTLGKPIVAECPHFSNHVACPERECSCGIYAVRNPNDLALYYPELGARPVAIGTVGLSGKIVEHRGGWRAEKAYPQKLFCFRDAAEETYRLCDSYKIVCHELDFHREYIHESRAIVSHLSTPRNLEFRSFRAHQEIPDVAIAMQYRTTCLSGPSSSIYLARAFGDDEEVCVREFIETVALFNAVRDFVDDQEETNEHRESGEGVRDCVADRGAESKPISGGTYDYRYTFANKLL